MYKNLARLRMSRSKVTGQGHQVQKTKNCWVILLTMHRKACALRRTLHAAADDATASQPGVTGWRQYTLTAASGVVLGPRGPCVRQFYAGGKISACCLVEQSRRRGNTYEVSNIEPQLCRSGRRPFCVGWGYHLQGLVESRDSATPPRNGRY